jgi:hypothetical protein
MTATGWRRELLKICRLCKHFYDRNISRNRYYCDRYMCHVYKANECKKTMAIREEAAALGKEALAEAFAA